MADQSPAGGRMSYWIADALTDARELANADRSQMAQILGTHEHTIKRLEEGISMGRDIDRTVAAYADLAGIDGREIWWAALYYWYERGSAPQFSAEGPAAAYAAALRDAALRLRKDGDGQSGRPTSIPEPSWLQRRKRQTAP